MLSRLMYKIANNQYVETGAQNLFHILYSPLIEYK
jgi:hypothetical protein